ncbi:histidine decarboxylase, pyruvoyl type [Fructobacillus sp. M1-13]|uniref:Histidine decarboxylase proenzyme n=1 Tax=Fructobacillus papyriferae TaxID=2713171 RepID=A0ABS5QSD0_9LACO|nr:histidine decarboxylase, pyruvoyl type [Fructobacillus papyriferae]MBS9335281.1 histidine decarboxylase, pyruvoyl type [Fructobacillus papyriferae]MCD2159050.1 histidine decarboxylase, pyruvoyl type [Fructobacillus papyriferae]
MNAKDFKDARAIGINSDALNNYVGFSRGYLEPGNIGEGYLTGLKVDAASTKLTDDELLDNISSYDRAEAKNANLAQINMETASSFTGPQGNIIGYDFLRNEELDKQEPLYTRKQWDGSTLPIYDAKPLQDALVEYLGTVDEPRFKTVPAAFITCANKGAMARRPEEDRPLKPGEGYGVWSAIALSIAEDPVHHSSMFVEDAGVWSKSDSEEDLMAYLKTREAAMAQSIANCGRHAKTTFKKTYIGFAHVMLKPGEFGTAITVGPYLTMPFDAVPGANRTNASALDAMETMRSLSLQDWLTKMHFDSLVKKNQITY